MKLIKQLNEQAELIDQLEVIDIAGKRLSIGKTLNNIA